MKIHGPNSRRGSGPGSKGRGRAAAFRAAHAVGEKVTGRLLAWEAQGLAWVDIQGHELLASIHSSPEPGRKLAFLIVQLYPDIMLQELHGHGGSAGAGPVQAVHGFWRARASFESAARDHLPGPGDVAGAAPDKRREMFLSRIRASPELAARLGLVLAEARRATVPLSATGAGRLVYAPWLAPAGAMCCETLVTVPAKGADQETITGFILPRAGLCLIRTSGSGDGSTVTAHAERAETRRILERQADSLSPSGHRLLKTSPVPAMWRGGLLAGLLAALAGPRRSGFARRV